MAIPLEDHVRQILLERDRGLKIYRAVTAGWAALAEYPQRHRWRRKSSARHMVWEEITQRLFEIAADDLDIVPIEHRDTVSLIVENEVLFRLKHADTTLLTANYPTAEALQFDRHDLDLYGFSGLQRVKLCYVPDEHEANLLWVGVAATNNGRFLWKIELNDAGAVADMPRLPFAEPTADPAKVARLKNPTEGKTEKKSDGTGG